MLQRRLSGDGRGASSSLFVDAKPIAVDHSGMDEIQYFQTTEPVGPRVGGGRFVAVGSILLLMTAASTLSTLVLARQAVIFLQYARQYGMNREWIGIAWAVANLAVLSTTFCVLGIGALLRRRWSRPLILAISWPWLALGALPTTLVACFMFRDIFHSYRPMRMEDFFIYAAYLGTIGTLCVFIPLANITLLQPARVRQALIDRDLKPRWTDTWPIVKLATLVALLVFSTLTTGVCLDIVQSQWPASTPGRWFSIVCATGSAILGLLAIARGYAIGWWLSVAGVATAGVVVATWFIEEASRTYFEFEEGSFIAAIGIAIIGLLVLLLHQFPLGQRRPAFDVAGYGAASE